MYSLNRAQIIGNLTRDPEMRYTPNGQAVCSFSVATNRRWRDKDGNNQEQVEFHDTVAWGKVAEILSQYARKGSKIYIEGRLQTRNWDAQDGTKKQRTEIIIEDFVFLSPKGEAAPDMPSSHSPAAVEDYPADISAASAKPAEKSAPAKPAKKEETSSQDDEINLDEIPF